MEIEICHVQVKDEEDVLLSTSSGQVIRQPLRTVKTMGRTGKGTILMRLGNESDRVITATFLDDSPSTL